MWRSLPEMSFCFNLKIGPSSRDVWKALYMPKKTLLTSNVFWKDAKLLWEIDNSCSIQESLG